MAALPQQRVVGALLLLAMCVAQTVTAERAQVPPPANAGAPVPVSEANYEQVGALVCRRTKMLLIRPAIPRC